jgi:hypothetical protein
MHGPAWNTEHKVALAVSAIVGAAAGIGVGYAVFMFRLHFGFWDWIAFASADVLLWAGIGAIVVAGSAYARRTLSN